MDAVGMNSQTPARGRKRKEAELSPAEIAQRLLRDLQPRFVKLAKCDGRMVEDEDQIWLSIGTLKKLSCEAKFMAGTHYDRIFRSFQGWAEANAKKLGVVKIYADAKDDEGDN